MSVVKGQEAVRVIRGQMWSPGRPSGARREDRVRFWEAVAGGVSSEDAAAGAGVSPAVGSRWFRQAGGMPPISLGSVSGVICRFPSGKRSLFFMRRVLGCVRSVAAWVVVRRRFRVSCAATLQPVAGALSIGPRLLSGTQSGVPAPEGREAGLGTTSFATMWRIVWVG